MAARRPSQVHVLSGNVKRLGGAAMEQAIFAGSNFAINVYLARELGLQSYSAFVVAYSWFLLTMSIHDAFVTEPMAIHGAGKYAPVLKSYLGFVFRSDIGVMVLSGSLMGLGAVVMGFSRSQLEVGAMLGTAMATPFLLTRWLTRQPFFIGGQPIQAAMGGAIYFVVSIGIIVWLKMGQRLTPTTAVLAMAGGSVVAGLVLTSLLGIDWQHKGKFSEREVRLDHWAYGKWSIANKVLAWVPGNIFFVLLPTFASLGDTGALRAASNLILPANMLVTAMMSIMLPSFSRSLSQVGPRHLAMRVAQSTLLVLGITGLLALLVAAFGTQAMHLIYRGQFDQYSTRAFYVALALQPVFTAPTVVYDCGLRVLGGVKWSLVSNIVPSLLAPVLGVIFFQHWGLTGVACAALLPQLLVSLLMYTFYRRELGKALAQAGEQA